jgi:hypothetical protein
MCNVNFVYRLGALPDDLKILNRLPQTTLGVQQQILELDGINVAFYNAEQSFILLDTRLPSLPSIGLEFDMGGFLSYFKLPDGGSVGDYFGTLFVVKAEIVASASCGWGRFLYTLSEKPL